MTRSGQSWIFHFSHRIPFPPGQLSSDNTLAGQVLVNQFLLRAGLVKKNKGALAYFKMVPFIPPLARCMRGFFSSIYCGYLVELLEINIKILWGPPYDWVPLEFLTLRVVHTELRQFNNYSSGFSTLALVPTGVSASESLLR